MNDIQVGIQTLLPPKRKLTPSGWTSFNAPCCHNRGESKDNRQRGGILLNPNGSFQYHCFNCNFKAGWTPGQLLTKNTKSLFKWMGMPDTDINKLALIALQGKETQSVKEVKLNFTLEERPLPNLTLSLEAWAKENLPEETENQLLEIFKYLNKRGMQFDWYPWHWSYEAGYRDRIIIPFYQDGKTVGWTARKITEGKPKYLTDAQPGYVFNLDRQTPDKKFAILVEGQFDAIAIDGIAVMHNEPNETQCARINTLAREIIVVPDRDKAGAKLIGAALKHDWTVSLPPWEEDIKDVADAVARYGRLYTLSTILHYRETNKIKIQLLQKKLQNLNG